MEGPVPWWLEEAPPDPEAPPLAGSLDAEVAIVGGGYTGLLTALELLRREPGLRVVVLEAERVGLGPSGRNGGFCHGLWASLRWLRQSFGADGALAVAAASSGVYDAVRAPGEDGWARDGGLLQVATTEAQEAAEDRAARTAA
jgi:glycine/D-amino acid oxidase-like deaminating enzyme